LSKNDRSDAVRFCPWDSTCPAFGGEDNGAGAPNESEPKSNKSAAAGAVEGLGGWLPGGGRKPKLGCGGNGGDITLVAPDNPFVFAEGRGGLIALCPSGTLSSSSSSSKPHAVSVSFASRVRGARNPGGGASAGAVGAGPDEGPVICGAGQVPCRAAAVATSEAAAAWLTSLSVRRWVLVFMTGAGELRTEAAERGSSWILGATA
jgi:hypothetical protein